MNDLKDKKYISTKEAAKVTGYTSDYVGQLARSNKISSKLIGHARFVDKQDLLAYRSHSEESNRKGGRKKPHAQPKEIRDTAKIKGISSVPVTFKAHPEDAMVRAVSLEPEASTHSLVPQDFFNRIAALAIACFVVLGSLALYKQHEETVVTFLPSFEIESRFTRQYVWYSFDAFLDEGLTASAQHALDGLDAVTNAAGITPASSALSRFGWTMYDGVVSLFARAAGWFSSSEEKTQYAVVREGLGLQNEGLVVVPTGSDDLSDEERLQRVEDSFSDEVIVEPGDNGRSGIIRPVFRTQEGESFLYVLVPVDEEQEEQ